MSDPVPDGSGVNLTWKAIPPSDAELIALNPVTDANVQEFNLPEELMTTVFIPSPSLISVHHASKKIMRVPEQSYKWLCVSFLLQSHEKDEAAGIAEAFDVQAEFERFQQRREH